ESCIRRQSRASAFSPLGRWLRSSTPTAATNSPRRIESPSGMNESWLPPLRVASPKDISIRRCAAVDRVSSSLHVARFSDDTRVSRTLHAFWIGCRLRGCGIGLWFSLAQPFRAGIAAQRGFWGFSPSRSQRLGGGGSEGPTNPPPHASPSPEGLG